MDLAVALSFACHWLAIVGADPCKVFDLDGFAQVVVERLFDRA